MPMKFKFPANDLKNFRKKLDELQTQQKTLGRTVNKKIMTTFEQVQANATELIQKHSVLEKDKVDIFFVVELY